ncbi:MAG: ribonuclease HII [Chloroflexia bacterium]
MGTTPTMDLEVALAVEGYAQVVGLDEAGRGALAARCTRRGRAPSLDRGYGRTYRRGARLQTVDCASLPRRVRGRDPLCCLRCDRRRGSEEIDELGIAPATRLAWVRALEVLPSADFLLLDAFPLPESSLPQRSIVHGDATCLSIAAASILAKTARDRFMIEAAAQSCVYGFSRNKGYGTREHLTALCEHGPGALHRRTFAPVRTWEQLRLGHLR